ncbi:MAG: fused MFS/spermidine synthase [Betaproteobacteria bacterium]|nr:fused MFS/spermidine synthase [Betaproteobacteria bacterium]
METTASIHRGRTFPTLYRAALAALCLLLAACQGVLVHEVRSSYSHIQVIDSGDQRALYFVGDRDLNVVETLIDMRQPHVLQHPHSRAVMAGFLYRPHVSSCLMVGLGGGALVRFIHHSFPEVRLDVVEIDPAVVTVARDFFGVSAGPRTRIFVEDGRDYLARTPERYDLILIDAHLYPSDRTDSTGHPLSLKTERFYRSIHERLNPGGVVMFKVIAGPDARGYLDSIRRAFAESDVYRPKQTGNVLVFAAPRAPLAGEAELRIRAREFDRRGGYGFSFERLLDDRDRRGE